MVRLSTWMPFRPASRALAFFTRVQVAEATLRQVTEQAGAAQVRIQEEQATALLQERAESPAGPKVELMSLDGCYIQVVGGEWKEVKTVALGMVNEPVEERGEQVVHTSELTYFSRMSESGQFRASRPGGNPRAGGREGGDGVCGERWSGLDPQVCGLPSPGCGAYPRCRLMPWSRWRKRAKPPTSSCLAQRNSSPWRSATSVQTGPFPALAQATTTRIENRRNRQGTRRTESVANPDARCVTSSQQWR